MLQKYLCPSVLDSSLIHLCSCVLEQLSSVGWCLFHFPTLGLPNILPVPFSLIHLLLDSTPPFLSCPVISHTHLGALQSFAESLTLCPSRHRCPDLAGLLHPFFSSCLQLYSQLSDILLSSIHHEDHFITSFLFSCMFHRQPQSHCTVPLPPVACYMHHISSRPSAVYNTQVFSIQLTILKMNAVYIYTVSPQKKGIFNI